MVTTNSSHQWELAYGVQLTSIHGLSSTTLLFQTIALQTLPWHVTSFLFKKRVVNLSCFLLMTLRCSLTTGVPIRTVADMGSETGKIHSLQEALRYVHRLGEVSMLTSVYIANTTLLISRWRLFLLHHILKVSSTSLSRDNGDHFLRKRCPMSSSSGLTITECIIPTILSISKHFLYHVVLCTCSLP